jgi:hypothetical protein
LQRELEQRREQGEDAPAFDPLSDLDSDVQLRPDGSLIGYWTTSTTTAASSTAADRRA